MLGKDVHLLFFLHRSLKSIAPMIRESWLLQILPRALCLHRGTDFQLVSEWTASVVICTMIIICTLNMGVMCKR